MNTGIQDAVNLGWKLAFAAAAPRPESLLASYDRERRPVARQMPALSHLAFWAGASTSPLPALARGWLAPLAAPLLPALLGRRWLITLLGRRWLITLGVRLLAQMWVAYPGSPLSVEGTPPPAAGPRAGQRLPDATVAADGRRGRLHALLAQPGEHLLLQRDAPDLSPPSLDPHVTVHRLTEAPGAGLIAVRPDGYVGYCYVAAVRTQLDAWLARVGFGS